MAALLAPHTPRRLEVLVQAEEPTRRQVCAALAVVTRRITAVADTPALLRRVWEQAPDVIILEGGGPPEAVQAACRHVRQFFQLPILVVEHGAGECERISWLDSGADDVLALASATSPELAARTYALFRRLQRQQRRDPSSLRLHALGLQLDIIERRLYLSTGQPLDLRASHTRMLALLFSYLDGLVPNAVLEQHLFGLASPTSQRRAAALVLSFNRQMARLPGPAPRVQRVRSSGYRLALVDCPPPRIGVTTARDAHPEHS